MAYLLTYFAYFAYFAYFLNICARSQYRGGLASIHPIHPADHRCSKARNLSKPYVSAYEAYSYYTTTGAGHGGCTGSNMRTSGQSLSGHVGLALILILV